MNDEEIKWPIDDLKGFAASICVQVFENYSESEAADAGDLVYKVWVIGREITEVWMETHRSD